MFVPSVGQIILIVMIPTDRFVGDSAISQVDGMNSTQDIFTEFKIKYMCFARFIHLLPCLSGNSQIPRFGNLTSHM